MAYLVKLLFVAAAAAAAAAVLRGGSRVPEAPFRSVAQEGPPPRFDPPPNTALRERVERAFQPGYFTLVSIIQGVALAALIQTYRDSAALNAEEWILLSVAGLIIAAVWQEYFISAMTFAWVPTALDAVIPFALGIVQALLIQAVTESVTAFAKYCFVFSVLGALAYGNYVCQARRGLGRSGEFARYLSPHLVMGAMIVVVCVGWYGGLWWWSSAFALGESGSIGAACLCALPILALFVRAHVYWTRPLVRSGSRA